MSAENRLHFFRMCAWDMFDPDALPRHERKIRLKQIRHVFEDCSFSLHVGVWGTTGKEQYPYYTLHDNRGRTILYGSGRKLGPLCAKILPIVDKKFPPKDVANPTR